MQKRNSTKPSVVSFYVVGIKEVLVYGKSEKHVLHAKHLA